MEARVTMEAAANPGALRWSRVATVAAVLLIHAGFVVLLLVPVGAWRWRGATRSSARSDALSLRFIALPSVVPFPVRARVLQHIRAWVPARHLKAVALATAPKPQSRARPDPDTDISPAPADAAPATEPTYIAGGGRFTDPDFARDNMHLPGSAQRVAGAPVLQMADPKMQGIAGAVRTVQRLFGIPDSHCVDLDAWSNMTRSERIAHHITDEQMDDYTERYHCIPPESGSDRYHH